MLAILSIHDGTRVLKYFKGDMIILKGGGPKGWTGEPCTVHEDCAAGRGVKLVVNYGNEVWHDNSKAWVTSYASR